jgi:NTE family protein
VALRRLVAGDCFGEMSLITGQLPSATARALTDGEAWTLDQATFMRLVTAQPQLSRNINAILSERLLYANRQQADAEPAQVIVGLGGPAALWTDLALSVARLSAQPVLLIDGREDAESAGPTLDDLLSGRIRVGGVALETDDDGLTVVRGLGGHGADELPAQLGRLDDHFRYQFVLLSPSDPVLTPQLVTYAARILLAGPIDQSLTLRAHLAALPRPLLPDMPSDISVILTDAPSRVRRTVAARELLEADLGAPVRAILPVDGAPYRAAIAALGRWLSGQRIGLVFGAGGPKGFAQLGALRVLRRIGLPLDVVTGTSVGAIVGGGVAMDLPTAEIEAAVGSLVDSLFRPTVPLRSILSSRAMIRWARGTQAYGERLIEDLPIEYAVSAADLTEGREIIIRRGLLWQAVLASAAIPGVYPPMMVGRHWLVDGGVVNPVPVNVARLLGADKVIALDLSEPLAARQELTLDGAPALRAPYLMDTLLRSRDIMMSEIRSHTAGDPALVINPKVTGVSLRHVRDAAPYTAAGEAAAEAALPQLRQLLPWLGQ